MAYYVVEVYSGRDAEAEQALVDAGLFPYRPVVTTIKPHHRYRGVTVKHENHLMPGYLFVKVPPAYARTRHDLNRIHNADYVLSILGTDEDTPCEIPDESVDLIGQVVEWLSEGREVMEFWHKLEPKAQEIARIWQTGDDVSCRIGSKIYRGMVLKNRGSHRVTVELQMKGYLKRVNVNSANLSAAA